jgi:hypothetical protein
VRVDTVKGSTGKLMTPFLYTFSMLCCGLNYPMRIHCYRRVPLEKRAIHVHVIM